MPKGRQEIKKERKQTEQTSGLINVPAKFGLSSSGDKCLEHLSSDQTQVKAAYVADSDQSQQLSDPVYMVNLILQKEVGTQNILQTTTTTTTKQITCLGVLAERQT